MEFESASGCCCHSEALIVIDLDVIRGPAGDGVADDIIEPSQTFCGLTPSLAFRKSRV
jgi:hypothetical protein